MIKKPLQLITCTCLFLLAGCAVPGAAPQPTSAPGELAGNVNIGPLTPVERVGVPTPTPPPEVFTSRGIQVFQADGKTPVTSVMFSPDGTYRVALAPGKYVVALLKPGIGGMGMARSLPAEVTIVSGQTTRLDIDIDTGIR